jgi:hypothetical protein
MTMPTTPTPGVVRRRPDAAPTAAPRPGAGLLLLTVGLAITAGQRCWYSPVPARCRCGALERRSPYA